MFKHVEASKVVLATCGPGSRYISYDGHVIRVLASAGPGLPLSRLEWEPPPGGKIIAVSFDGCVLEDGSCFYRGPKDASWTLMGNLNDAGTS